MQRWWSRIVRHWPGLSRDSPAFFLLGSGVPAWRLWLATVVAAGALVAISRWSHSTAAGYGYGLAVFIAISWPLAVQVVQSLRWTEATWGQSLLLLGASLIMGRLADRWLGFNPQAPVMSKLSWPLAAKLLWEFPLLLPIENLLLLGALLALWKTVPRKDWRHRLAIAVGGAFLFGLWHVPFWGGWTLVTVGLSVLPWTLYLLATGDMLAPLVAHILMDGWSIIAQAAPERTFFRQHLVWTAIFAVLLGGAARSFLWDWRNNELR